MIFSCVILIIFETIFSKFTKNNLMYFFFKNMSHYKHFIINIIIYYEFGK